MSGAASRPPIELRLARAGLPPLPRTAWLELDLDALRTNLEILRAVVGPGVRVEPVVKADAYGHGAAPIALALEAAGADGLSVATLDEGLELRAAGVTLPVLVLYPIPPDGVAEAARAGIATSTGPGLLTARLLAAAAAWNASAGTGARPLEVHIEVETGLGRGGVLPDMVPTAVDVVLAAPGVRLAGVWTHLAAADDRDSALGQDEAFGRALAPLVDAVHWGPDAIRRHLAGSGGVLAAGLRRWDSVRTGLSVYGMVPDALTPPAATAGRAAGLRPVMSLLARPVRVMELPGGHGISYGPSFVTTRPSRIATLPVGYGDGWRRDLSDQAEALVRGVRVPLVGRVAMDAVMADVTEVPGPAVTEDDEFVLLGEQEGERITAFDLAATAGTISYEVVTAMARRLPRVYHAAGSPVGIRTLAGGRSDWHASSSGTAISATSRSMPS
ncbi:MAG: alanine racemase [Chloroflexi bacterium RBG_16_72_14]|nr:MAG: alanine racemase [Chloroflexi bacterium RBG_16_72_14]